jgi:hypothetical protein
MSSAVTLPLGTTRAPGAKTLAWAALAALVCGLAFFALAATVAIGFSRAADAERLSDEGWQLVRATIVGERVNQVPYVLTTPQPGQAMMSVQLVPQIEVQYTVGGQELRTWVDVPAPGMLDANQPGDYNLATSALARYHYGDAGEFYCDPADASSLRLSGSDGGRRTLLAGSILASIACVPGVGLVLTSWLLWRAGRKQRQPAAAQ